MYMLRIVGFDGVLPLTYAMPAGLSRLLNLARVCSHSLLLGLDHASVLHKSESYSQQMLNAAAYRRILMDAL